MPAIAATAMIVAWASPSPAQTMAPPAASPTPAATTPQTTESEKPGDTIVVTGHLPDAAQVRALTRQITRRHVYGDPVGRFIDPICFGTAGLPRPMLLTLANRMLLDVQQAGIPLAGDNCKPNILVLFADDGQAELAQIRKSQAWLFGDLTPSEINRIINEPGPVHVWTGSEIRGVDGDRIHGGQLLVPISSFLVLPIRRDLLFSVMLIDRHAVVGRSLMQIADYAAMRTLAMTRPRGVTGQDTILALFDPNSANPPAEMTRFDRGYLKGLYAGRGNLSSIVKLDQIAHGIVKDAKTGQAAEPATAPAGEQ